MNFSKRSRYGIRALIDLAQHEECGCTRLMDLAERNNISVKYLEQIFMALRKAGILGSLKGVQGGYFLAQHPRELTVARIVSVLEVGYMLESETGDAAGMDDGRAMAIQCDIIDPINRYTQELLCGLTLEKLVESADKKQCVMQDMYYI